MIFLQLMQKGIRLVYTFPIYIYQKIISPHLPSSCRYDPSCSRYFREAVLIHGIFKGTWLGIRRILRCNPWGGVGYDPVPPKIDKKTKKSPSDTSKEPLK